MNTGDNLSHQRAVPAVVQSLGRLLAVPACSCSAANDYFAPKPKNPMKYFQEEPQAGLG